VQFAAGIHHARPFPIWVGFALCVLIFVAEVVDASMHTASSWYFWTADIVTFVYYLMCVYRFHKIMGEVTFGDYSIKPAEAVYSHLIPLLNVYWLYAWPSRFADYVRAERAIKVASSAIIGSLLLGSALVARFFDAAIGLAGYFCVMAYMTNRLRCYADYRDLDAAVEQLTPAVD
jgi:hypothetical protein